MYVCIYNYELQLNEATPKIFNKNLNKSENSKIAKSKKHLENLKNKSFYLREINIYYYYYPNIKDIM